MSEPDFAVLVIEDNEYSRMTIVDFLDEGGINTIYEASDGEEALEVMADNQVDLVICDIIMEPMDGWEFIDALREQGIQTPVIVLTGQEDADTIEEARSRKVETYLSKPISKRRLLEKVQSLTEGN